jgi:hypothetical protein
MIPGESNGGPRRQTAADRTPPRRGRSGSPTVRPDRCSAFPAAVSSPHDPALRRGSERWSPVWYARSRPRPSALARSWPAGHAWHGRRRRPAGPAGGFRPPSGSQEVSARPVSAIPAAAGMSQLVRLPPLSAWRRHRMQSREPVGRLQSGGLAGGPGSPAGSLTGCQQPPSPSRTQPYYASSYLIRRHIQPCLATASHPAESTDRQTGHRELVLDFADPGGIGGTTTGRSLPRSPGPWRP